jgi:hypothetical protein
MKEIKLLIGEDIIQAIVDAFYAVDEEPITISGNGVRIILMKDRFDEIVSFNPKSVIEVKYACR